MPINPRIEQLSAIKTPPGLLDCLRDVLNWPIEDFGVEELICRTP
jgi:hypothetical protein